MNWNWKIESEIWLASAGDRNIWFIFNLHNEINYYNKFYNLSLMKIFGLKGKLISTKNVKPKIKKNKSKAL